MANHCIIGIRASTWQWHMSSRAAMRAYTNGHSTCVRIGEATIGIHTRIDEINKLIKELSL